MTREEVGRAVRVILAEVMREDEAAVARLPDDTELFGSGIALGSVSGAALLHLVHERLGVDVAGEDLNLDSLTSVGTLCDFVAARAASTA